MLGFQNKVWMSFTNEVLSLILLYSFHPFLLSWKKETIHLSLTLYHLHVPQIIFLIIISQVYSKINSQKQTHLTLHLTWFSTFSLLLPDGSSGDQTDLFSIFPLTDILNHRFS